MDKRVVCPGIAMVLDRIIAKMRYVENGKRFLSVDGDF